MTSHANATALTRDCRESARLYGAEARRYYGDCSWDAVRPHLELGWARVRRDDTPWQLACPEVHAGWTAQAQRPLPLPA